MIGQYFGLANGNWKLDGNANDASGNGNNGTASNVTWTTGRFGNCGSFNGSNSKIELPNSSSLKPTTFTVMAWYKGTQSTLGTIIENFYFYNSGAVYYGWFFGLNSGVARFVVAKGTGVATYPHIDQVATLVSINDNKWHHVAATIDSSGILKIYVDGALSGTKNWGYAIAYYSTQYPAIGVRLDSYGAPTEYLSGAVDEVVITGYMTDAQIRRWYAWSTGKL